MRILFFTRFARRLLGALACAPCVLAATGSVFAQVFVPKSDSDVLETVRAGPASPAEEELRKLRSAYQTNRLDLAVSMRLARMLTDRGRAEADPRFLSRASMVITPWSTNAEPPLEVLILRAIIRQNLHDFGGALSDLNAVLARDPRQAEAWLVKATIHTTRGEFNEARLACLQLPRLVDDLTTMAATAQVAGLSGEAARSYELLRDTLSQRADAPGPIRHWSLIILADIATRLGKEREAEEHFKAALRLKPADPYTLASYADFLLLAQRPEDVIDLLWKFTRIDALLLRVAEAEKSLASPDLSVLASHVGILESRFEAAHRRGDTVHRREEARLRIKVLGDSATAHELAKANWNVQREPADIRLLMETSKAVRDSMSLAGLQSWILTNRYEDVALRRIQ